MTGFPSGSPSGRPHGPPRKGSAPAEPFRRGRCRLPGRPGRMGKEVAMSIKTFGTIDRRSLDQLERCMEAGDADFGVLCADHHPRTSCHSAASPTWPRLSSARSGPATTT